MNKLYPKKSFLNNKWEIRNCDERESLMISQRHNLPPILAKLLTLRKIKDNQVDILVGTQMISKGFNFPKLNCIVVLDIDLSSLGHDLRGGEKNLQLYHQLSGRAGRTGNPATVYFQTYNLSEKIISQITSEDPFNFLDKELNLRRKNNLPPYERFISLILSAKDEKKLEVEALNFKDYLQKKIVAKILGPVNAPIYKIKKKVLLTFLTPANGSVILSNFTISIGTTSF